MEDGYANYTINADALKDGLAVLGFIAAGVGAALAICNPVSGTALALAGMCTGVGILCDSLTLAADLSKGDTDEIYNTAFKDAVAILLKKFGMEGIMKTGAQLSEDEQKIVEALVFDMPKASYDLGNHFAPKSQKQGCS